MVEFGTSFAFRGWVRVLGYGFGVRSKKVKSRDCALASDLIKALVEMLFYHNADSSYTENAHSCQCHRGKKNSRIYSMLRLCH